MGRRILGVMLGLALLAAVWAPWAGAAPIDDGLSAYHKGNFKAALELFRPLANKGDPYALFNLGRMYDKGQGVKADSVQAYKWYSIASTRYAPPQLEQKNTAIAQFTRIATKMTPEQVAAAQKEARAWKPQA